MRYRGHSGFTLVELLVVVLIIAILAAILFPVLASARRNALKASCISNERQIISGILLYSQDNEGRLPPGYETGAWDPYNWSNADYCSTIKPMLWHIRLLRYVKSAQLFICPVVPKSMLADSSGLFKPGENPNTQLGRYPTTYGYNWRLCSNGGRSGLPPTATKNALKAAGDFGVTVTTDSLAMPSRTIMICEAQFTAQNVLKSEPIPRGGGSLVYSDVGDFYWNIRWLKKPYIPQGHNGGANFGLGDGHVKFVIGFQPIGGAAPTTSAVERAGLRWW